MGKNKSYRGGMVPGRNFTRMYARTWRNVALAAAMAAGMGLGATGANAAESLWISAPDWSYSAAYAATSSNFAYFWGLSSGQGTYSFAGAYANDAFGSAAAFAVASAGYGGYGAVDAVGFADPYAGIEIDNSSFSSGDISNTKDYLHTKPSPDPFSSAHTYTISDSGITFSSELSSELNGADGLQAFLYTGGSDPTSFDTLLGLTGTSGNSSSGNVSSITALEGIASTSNGVLTALDPVISDPASNAGITFTTSITSAQQADVILVGFEDAASTPIPSSLSLSMLGLLGLAGLAIMRRRSRLRRSALR